MNTPDMLSDRWNLLCRRLGVTIAQDAVFNALCTAYQEPQRHYHTLQHLQHCLDQLDRASPASPERDRIEMALWFHDAIYDPERHDNEERSAQWARSALTAAGIPTGTVAEVTDLILATRHHSPPASPTAALLVDIDLSILGETEERYDRYEQAIAREYAWLPASQYRAGRARVLKHFLDQVPLFRTPFFQQWGEGRARENLRRALSLLGVDNE